MAERTRKPFGVHPLIDSEPYMAVIRYDGDPDVFAALAWAYLADRQAEYEDGHYSVEPPDPRLYRLNPTVDPDFSWLLGRPTMPGRGTFVGAVLTRGRNWQCPYCFGPTPDHLDDCVTLSPAPARRRP
jgi:hypothetical protein